MPQNSLHSKNIIIIENPSEVGAGTRGAGLGPVAVRLEDNGHGNKIYGKFPFRNIDSFNHLMVNPTEHEHAKYIDLIVRQNERLMDAIQSEFKAGNFPILLSGDHSNALGSIAAVKDANPSKRCGVIWIDAHADLHTPYTTPSGNVHGMPLGVSLGEGYSSEAVNNLNDSSIEYWHQLTHIGTNQIHPKILPSDLVLIAIRDLEEQEWNDIDANNIKHYVPARLQNRTMQEIAEETLAYLTECDLIYISFDVDSMDPSVSEGTGTSVDNGLTLEQAKALLFNLCKSEKLALLEITEINPLIDDRNKMAKAALDIMKHLLL
ncbi:MAG: arginase [Bacteroidia bacterium]|jgi:arginase